MKKIKLLSIIGISFLLVGCGSTQNNTKNYEDYYAEHSLTALDDFYNKGTGTYYIYLYSEFCSHCENIKDTVLSYYDLDNPSNPTMYLFNMNKKGSEEGDIYRLKFKQNVDSSGYLVLREYMDKNHPTSLNDTYFIGTPTIYVIKNNKYDSMLLGDEEITTYLNNNYLNASYNEAFFPIVVVFALSIAVFGSVFLIRYKEREKNN